MRERQSHRAEQRRPNADGGQAVVEFAIVAPILLFVMLGIIVFGIAFNQYLQLTNATNIGALALSESRSQTTDPCQTTVTAVENAAPSLTPSNLTFYITPNTTATPASTYSGASPSCPSAASSLSAGNSAQVEVTYPCKLQFMSFNHNCNLTANTVVRIQ